MMVADRCDIYQFDKNKVEHSQTALAQIPAEGMVAIFKALADATRMKVAYALSIEAELCVCDVANIIGASTATASHHLRYLLKRQVVKFRRDGKMVYYSLKDEHVKQLLEIAYLHAKEEQR
nr:metalloregulator ArsR/SmtB family transcription factor [Rubeoparvulum massiliense]